MRSRAAPQLPLDLGLKPVVMESGLVCCPYCVDKHGFAASLAWQPPDYKRGSCVYCRREFQMDTKFGEAEQEENND